MRGFRTKIEVLRIIIECAALYDNNLAHKKILFVTDSPNNKSDFEALFMPHNFKHLTGAGKKNIDALVFYKRALDKRLGVDDIIIDNRGFTDLKLDILSRLMNIHKTARMVGDFDNLSEKIVADKFAGTTTSAMGFEFKNNIYIPKTALKTSVNDVTKKDTRSRIIAIFTKNKVDSKYTDITYKAHDMEYCHLLQRDSLRKIVDFGNLILPESWNILS
ncbi:MAG: hypothetical protein LBC71_01270 [Oscillospiraceae bacterium]|jgi:hypothetical protein|nr:hypothetical protein [Oscillospiraceae bacterium]